MKYAFHVAGHLDARWQAAFDGFTIAHRMTSDNEPITLLIGPMPDQAALYGMVSRLRDLGATLISVHPAEPHEIDTPAGDQPADVSG